MFTSMNRTGKWRKGSEKEEGQGRRVRRSKMRMWR